MYYIKYASILAAVGLAGAVGLSLLAHLFCTLKFPQMTRDGQYGMIFFFITGPMGWLLGSVLGAILANHNVKHLEGGGWLALVLVLMGLSISPYLGILPFAVIGYFTR